MPPGAPSPLRSTTALSLRRVWVLAIGPLILNLAVAPLDSHLSERLLLSAPHRRINRRFFGVVVAEPCFGNLPLSRTGDPIWRSSAHRRRPKNRGLPGASRLHCGAQSAKRPDR